MWWILGSREGNFDFCAVEGGAANQRKNDRLEKQGKQSLEPPRKQCFQGGARFLAKRCEKGSIQSCCDSPQNISKLLRDRTESGKPGRARPKGNKVLVKVAGKKKLVRRGFSEEDPGIRAWRFLKGDRK